GALVRFRLLGRGVDLRRLLAAACAEEETGGDRDAIRAHGGPHVRTAFTRWRMSARTFGGRWFQRTPATAPASARHDGTQSRSGFTRRSCSHASQKPTRISASSESIPIERSSAASERPMLGVCSIGVAVVIAMSEDLQCECRSFTAADAERGDPLLQPTLLERVDERCDDACAGGADG